MTIYEATGRTVEEAISAGLEHLGAAIGDVTVDILQEGSKGLFGLFGSRPAKVRLTLNADTAKESSLDTRLLFADSLEEKRAVPRKPAAPVDKQPAPVKQQPAPEKRAPRPAQQPQADKKPAPAARQTSDKVPAPVKQAAKPAPEKKRPAPKPQPAERKPLTPAQQADAESAAGRAQAFLQELTRLMGTEVAVAVHTDEEGNVRVDMAGDTQGILIGRRGETLDALQYLTSLQVNKGRSEYTRVTLDTEGYRARREEALIRLANRMANRAVKTGRRVSMEPMNPYERRILHSALQNNPAVATHSEGEEPNRHVVITVNKPPRAEKLVQEEAAVVAETAVEVKEAE